jgi:predicted MFS family arabinose efflux permease
LITGVPERVALGGLIVIAAAMGIGRFVYTPILPFMDEGLGLTKAQGGLIASANYLGYLVGALAASLIALPGGRRNWILGALAISALSTGAMGLPSSMLPFLILRFIGGVASALVLVVTITFVLDHLKAAGRMELFAVNFSGVGLGIVLSALLISGLATLGYGWQVQWFYAGTLSCAALGLAAWVTPGDIAVQQDAVTSSAAPMDRALIVLIVAYGLFGFGYIITATFISAMVRSQPEIQSVEPVIWLVVGVAAFPSGLVWLWVGRRIGVSQAFSAACLTEAVGVALSVLVLTPTAILLSAVLLGGTFIGITALGLVKARDLSTGNTRRDLGFLTAAFALGQIIGPTFAGYAHGIDDSFLAPSLAAAAALVLAAGLAITTRR